MAKEAKEAEEAEVVPRYTLTSNIGSINPKSPKLAPRVQRGLVVCWK